jgi:ubiquinone/menaquinone biosynthesis C-methylase UbiE
MRLMAERVGASGQVTGVDNDGRLGREALEILRATVPGWFEFVHADVEATEELPGGPFDLVYSQDSSWEARRCQNQSATGRMTETRKGLTRRF